MLSPFIELGVGFNSELTARDNIVINGTLLGLTKRQIKERFDAIVGFAELERFVDQKLKNFSSGMQVRLAYSIAIQVDFDILLLDEVLAVGDQEFQRRCLETLAGIRGRRQDDRVRHTRPEGDPEPLRPCDVAPRRLDPGPWRARPTSWPATGSSSTSASTSPRKAPSPNRRRGPEAAVRPTPVAGGPRSSWTA